MTLKPVNQPIAIKSLCLFTNILDVKKSATRQVGADKFKPKAMKYGNTPWALNKSKKGIQKLMTR